MAIKVEQVNPYHGDNRDKTEQVGEMFDSIAPAYDFMNHAMTMGIDKWWRRLAVKMVAATNPASVLDIAAGTGDLSIMLAHKITGAQVLGVDLSEGMIEKGRRRIESAGLSERVRLSIADCMDMPFADDSFDCVTSAYGVRNFENLLQGYKEMHRVMRPGGMLCIIEMSTPTSKIALPFYNLYTRHIIPLAGKLVSKDVSAYSYLPESIAAVPQGAEMCGIIESAGFGQTAFRPLTFGTCTIYTAFKPQ